MAQQHEGPGPPGGSAWCLPAPGGEGSSLAPLCASVEPGADGTRVTVTLASKSLLVRDVAAAIEDLGFDIASFSVDRPPGSGATRANKTYRGVYIVTDEEGAPLSPDQVDRLLLALHGALTSALAEQHGAAGSSTGTGMAGSGTPGGSGSLKKSDSLASNLSGLQDGAAGGHRAHHQRHASGVSTEGDVGGLSGGDSFALFDRFDSLRTASQPSARMPSLPGAPSLPTGPLSPSSASGGGGAGPGVLHGAGGGVASPRALRAPQAHAQLRLGDAHAVAHHHHHHHPLLPRLSDTPSADGSDATTLRSTLADGMGGGMGTGAVSVAGACHQPPQSARLELAGSRDADDVELDDLPAARLTVDAIMRSPVHTVHKDADIAAAKLLMSRTGVSALLVDTDSPMPGFVTKRDFLKVSFTKSMRTVRVRDVMTHPVIAISSGTTLREAVRLLAAKGVRRLPVVDVARVGPTSPLAAYIGVVSDTDVYRVLSGSTSDAQVSVGGPGLTHASTEPARCSTPGFVAPLRSAGFQAPCLHHYQSNVSTSAISVGSLAHSISSLSEQAKNISTEDRHRTAAALWELDFNELEVTRKIGVGSFGEVLLANFRGTKVAVKRMRGFELSPDNDEPGPSPTMMPVFAEFFEREIEIMASIRHPNVVNFIGACHTPPNVCLVTEYCARGSLDHLLHKSGLHLDLVKKIEFAMDIARGMSCLHAQRPAIVHRDLKPANLLVSARFEVKVADLGLSRIKDHAQLVNSRAGLEGTVEYCAPEVLRGEPFNEKADIWSYGIVLWELLNRQRPYADTDSPVYIMMMALGTGSLRLPAVREEVASPGLVRLVDRCMAWLPADRPSFREILHALEHEYKAVRGKAAAVPRSDSAASMTVLGLHHHQHSESAAEMGGGGAVAPSGARAHGHGAGALSGAPPRHPPPGLHIAVPAAAAAHSSHPSPVDSSPAGGLQHPGGPPALRTSSERHSAHVASRFGPARSTSGKAGAAGDGGAGSGVASPQGSGGGKDGWAAGVATPPSSNGSGGKPGRPPRPPHARMARARSTPLPSHLWFAEATGEGSWETDATSDDHASTAASSDSNQPIGPLPGAVPGYFRSSSGPDASFGQASFPPSASAATAVSGAPRLANIPETGSLHDSGGMLTAVGVWQSSAGAGVPGGDAGLHSPSFGEDLLGGRGGGLTPLRADSPPLAATPAPAPRPPAAFSSPFNGFLPFSDEPLEAPPDTPKIVASGAATAAGIGSGFSESDSSAAGGLAALPLLPPAPAAPAPRRMAQFHSAFAAFAQADATEEADSGPEAGEQLQPLAPAPPPVAPSAPKGRRTGNFFSPFAVLEAEEDASARAAADPSPGHALDVIDLPAASGSEMLPDSAPMLTVSPAAGPDGAAGYGGSGMSGAVDGGAMLDEQPSVHGVGCTSAAMAMSLSMDAGGGPGLLTPPPHEPAAPVSIPAIPPASMAGLPSPSPQHHLPMLVRVASSLGGGAGRRSIEKPSGGPPDTPAGAVGGGATQGAAGTPEQVAEQVTVHHTSWVTV